MTFLRLSYVFWSLSLIFSLFGCSKKPDLSSLTHSVREEVDLFLIPHKFNVLESEWVKTRSPVSYQKQDLIRHLKSYGRSLSDLQKDPALKYKESDDLVSMEVAKTSHSTFYNYDKQIPIVLYGEKWFHSGEYPEVINQQHIVPTLAKILKIRNPNGVETHPLLHILKNQNSSEKPEMIVTVVIDQGGQQLYKSHPDIPENIAKIKKLSAYFPNAEVGHLDAHTAVGHAAIGTGAYPSKNQVIGNTFFYYEKGKVSSSEIYAGQDESLVNPAELYTETLADVLDNENTDQSEVISQCYALRASIGMAGHGAFKLKNVSYAGDKDFIYWLDKKTGRWTTDTRYYSLPEFAKDFNPLENYMKEYPHGWRDHPSTTKEEVIKNWTILLGSPAEVKLEAELFRKTIQEEIIKKNRHNDGYTDLAYVTLKATDAAGHNFGWESLQSRETFKETDKQVGLIFEMLKKEYGDKFIMIITADHGCAPMPEISGGKRLTINELFDALQSLLPAGTEESITKFATVGQISLNREVMQKYGIKDSQIREKLLSIQVDGSPFFKEIIFKSDLNLNR